jgi:hypothetical protein
MFIVSFTSMSVAYVIDFAHPDGLRALDNARAVLGPQVDYIARQESHFCRFDVCCDVSESQARRAFAQSGAFGENRQVKVIVPAESLTRFVSAEWRLMAGSETIAECQPVIRYADIVDAWLSEGAPATWTPADSKTDNDNR